MQTPNLNSSSIPVAVEHAGDQAYNGASQPLRRATIIQDWLVAYLARELKVTPEEMDVTAPFDRYGLSSVTAVLMIGNLEDWLGAKIDPTLPYDYPTIETLAEHLARLLQ